MPSLPITTRLDKEAIEKLEKLADATKRSKSFLVAEAVDRYLHEQEWQVAAIKMACSKRKKVSLRQITKFVSFLKSGE